jgi:Glycosyltransferase family 87
MRPKFLRAGRMSGLDWGQLALLVWTVVLLAVCLRSAIQPRSRSLFCTYALAGSDWMDGNNLYFHYFNGEWPAYLDQFRYSPLVAVLLTPLALLNERAGNVLWRLFNASVLLGALWWWLRAVLPDARTNSLKAMMALLIAPLALASLNNGQTNPLVIGFLLAATAALHDQRWNLAAVFIALACALKLYPLAVGLLLLLVYPKQLSWRLALALLAAALLPFCFQRPAYVLDQYRQWWQLLDKDDRWYFPLNIAYRDLWLLFRIGNIPLTPAGYRVIQLALAALCAVLCLAARWAGLGKARQLTTALMLGCCWMTLCGPATESSSFVQIGPALAWSLVASRLERWPPALRWLPEVSFALLLAGVLAGLTPWTGRIHGLGIQPLGTLLLFVAYLAATIWAMRSAKTVLESSDSNITARAA